MNAEARQLANGSIQNTEAKSRGKLLASGDAGLEDIAEVEATNRTVWLQARAQPVDAEIAQRTTRQYQATGGVNSDVAAIDQKDVAGTHRDCYIHVGTVLDEVHGSNRPGKAEIIGG